MQHLNFQAVPCAEDQAQLKGELGVLSDASLRHAAADKSLGLHVIPRQHIQAMRAPSRLWGLFHSDLLLAPENMCRLRALFLLARDAINTKQSRRAFLIQRVDPSANKRAFAAQGQLAQTGLASQVQG
jgi:hypothetical protein